MTKASERTKQIRIRYWTLYAASVILTIGPMIGYLVYGYIVAETQQKVVLSMTTVCAIIFGALNVIFKKQLRSVVWLLLLGIAYAIDKVTGLVIIMAICTIVDEFAVHPAVQIYKTKLITNKEMDARGVQEPVTGDT